MLLTPNDRYFPLSWDVLIRRNIHCCRQMDMNRYFPLSWDVLIRDFCEPSR